jgi:tetraacyldisaccharide 4'-kinase
VIGLWTSRHPAAAAARAALAPAAFAYDLVRRGRLAVHGAGAPHRLPRPSIGVRALQVGGAGKSPIASWAAGWFAARGARPGILLRGYGGDEGPMHRALEPRAVVVEDPDRLRGAARAVAEGAEVLVLDDHGQHLPVRADHTLLLFGADALCGPRALLPAGPWRQPWDSGEGDVLVLTAREEREAPSGRRTLARAYPGRPVAEAVLVIAGWCALGRDAAPVEPDPLGRTLLPVCGIADPRAFLAHVRSCGEVRRAFAFGDHARYGPGRVRRLVRAAELARVDYVVTTAKDAVKLGPVWPADAPPVLVAQLAVRWVAGEADVTRALDACLQVHRARSATSPQHVAAVSAAGTA